MVRALPIVVALLLAGPAVPARGSDSEAAYQFTVAKMLAQEGEYSEALAAYGRAADLEPGDPFIRIEFAQLLLRLGQFARAEEQATAARDMAPREISVLTILGRIKLALAERRSGPLEEAREVFEEIRQLAPWDSQAMITLGEIYLSMGQPAEAAEVFRELWSYRPNQQVVYSFLVDSLLRADRPEEAEIVLREILEVHPDYVRGRMSLAEILAKKGDHPAAAEVLAAAPTGESADPDLQRQLAMELFRSGDPAGALPHLEGILEEQPEDPGVRYLRALTLIALQRGEEAEAELRRLVAGGAGMEVVVQLARLLEQNGQVDEAERILRTEIESLNSGEKASEARQIEVQLAYLLARRGNWREVAALTGSLLDRSSSADLEVALLRSEALQRLDQSEEALATLSRIDDETPDARLARAREAEILLSMGRDDEVSKRLEVLAASGEVRDLLMAAEVYQGAGRYADAVGFLNRALEVDRDSTQVQFWLGAAYERAGRRSEAESQFETLLKAQPDFAPALNYLGYMWAEKGENLERALELVERAVSLEPDNGAYLDSLGWAHYKLGMYAEARGHLERASELVPDDAVVFEHLGDLYSALGERDEARTVYERALELGGENQGEIRDKLRRLQGEF